MSILCEYMKSFSLIFIVILFSAGFVITDGYGENKIESSTYVSEEITRMGNPVVDFRNDIFTIVNGEIVGIPNDDGNMFLLKFNNDLSEIISYTSFRTSGHDYPLLAIDSDGNVFVSGNVETIASDIPTTPGAYLESTSSKYGYYILKFDNSLDQLLAGTFVGVSPFVAVPYISINDQDDVVLTGSSGSSDHPTTPGAYDETCGSDGFISKFSNDLTQLLASTCLGNKKNTSITGQAVFDLDGNIYVIGQTSDSEFPTTTNAYDTTYNGASNDVIISKFSPDLTELLSSTFLGSTGIEHGYGLVFDNDGNLVLTMLGNSKSQYPSASGFPTTVNAFSREFTGNSYEIIVSKLDSELTSLLASTFINGNGEDHVSRPIIDSSNNVILTGTTQSTNFPTTVDAFDSQMEKSELFISVLDNSLSTLLSSTFLGGSDNDSVSRQPILDNDGQLIITGGTFSDDFPTTSGVLFEEKTFERSGFLTKIILDIPSISEIPDNNILKQIHSVSAFGEIQIESYDVILIPDSTETVKITGNIKSTSDENTVLLVITHPDASKENRKVVLNGNSFEKLYEIDSTFDDGEYEINGFYDEQQIGTVFFSLTKSLSKSVVVDSEPEPTPEPTPDFTENNVKPKPSFVDETKDPQSYVDRYENEPSYKEWFDENYSDYTIYEAVGLEEPKTQTIVTIDPEPVPDNEPTCGTGTVLKNGICIVDSSKTNVKLDDLRKLIPDYYNYDELGAVESDGGTYIHARIQKDGGARTVDILQFTDENKTWDMFKEQKQRTKFVEPVTDLSATCYEGWSTEYVQIISCVKNDLLIIVQAQNTETKSVMKQILDKIDGSTPISNIAKNIESNGGGCLIATATYGSELAPQVQQLRELRDNQLLQTESGAAFMGTFNDVYYSFSPIIADYERENPYFKEAVKLAITPLISSLSLMENAESESEVLSIGISVIMLNLGMYFGVPAVVVVGIRKRF